MQFIALALFGLAQARPQVEPVKPDPIAVTSYVYNVPDETGAFNYAFEAENGIKQEASSQLKTFDDGTSAVVMQGSYEYIGPDGLTYVVNWIADESGYKATAAHLPKPVEIPYPEIQEAVDAQIAFAAATEPTTIVEV